MSGTFLKSDVFHIRTVHVVLYKNRTRRIDLQRATVVPCRTLSRVAERPGKIPLPCRFPIGPDDQKCHCPRRYSEVG